MLRRQPNFQRGEAAAFEAARPVEMLAVATDRQAAFGFNIRAGYGQGRQHLWHGAYQFGNAFAVLAFAVFALPTHAETRLAAEVAFLTAAAIGYSA